MLYKQFDIFIVDVTDFVYMILKGITTDINEHIHKTEIKKKKKKKHLVTSFQARFFQ